MCALSRKVSTSTADSCTFPLQTKVNIQLHPLLLLLLPPEIHLFTTHTPPPQPPPTHKHIHWANGVFFQGVWYGNQPQWLRLFSDWLKVLVEEKKTAHFVFLAEVVKRDSDFIFSFSINLNSREKTYKDHIFHLDLPFTLFFSESFKTALKIFVSRVKQHRGSPKE